MSVFLNSILDHVYPLYAALLVPFGTPDFGPKLATGLLAIGFVVLIGFLCLAVPQAFRLRAALSAIKGKNGSETEAQKRAAFKTDYPSIDKKLQENRTIALAWQEFRKTIIPRGEPQRAILLSSRRPQDFFNPRNLHTQYEFVRSLPNFFVGLGLLGTFIGLIAALTFSTQRLTSAVDQEQIKAALSQLLSTAAAKFYISAAGLVASLVISLAVKIVLKHLNTKVHQINEALEERLLFVTEQNITEKQLSVQQDSLEELKLFNTNIAMKVGDAVRNAVQDGNVGLEARLTEISSSISKLASSSGEGAGEALSNAMKGAFDESLKRTSDAFGSMASQLGQLPATLHATVESIQAAGRNAAQQQAELSERISETLKATAGAASTEFAQALQAGTQDVLADLRSTGSKFADVSEKIEIFLGRFQIGGDGYLQSLADLSNQSTKLANDLTSASTQMMRATDDAASANSILSSNIDKVLAGIGELARSTSEVTRSVADSQQAIRGSVETLLQQITQHTQRFDAVDERLAGVFNTIAGHLELQSRQMADQLSTMDQALARAVNQFEQLIDDLADLVPRRQAAE